VIEMSGEGRKALREAAGWAAVREQFDMTQALALIPQHELAMAIEAVDMVRAELVRLSNAYRPRVLSEQDRATGP
jgi:hypothetical protein